MPCNNLAIHNAAGPARAKHWKPVGVRQGVPAQLRCAKVCKAADGSHTARERERESIEPARIYSAHNSAVCGPRSAKLRIPRGSPAPRSRILCKAGKYPLHSLSPSLDTVPSDGYLQTFWRGKMHKSDRKIPGDTLFLFLFLSFSLSLFPLHFTWNEAFGDIRRKDCNIVKYKRGLVVQKKEFLFKYMKFQI